MTAKQTIDLSEFQRQLLDGTKDSLSITTYEEMVQAVKVIQYNDNIYYDLLLRFAEDIIRDTEQRPKYMVAKDINMSQPVFSRILHLITAHQRAITPQHPHIIGTEDAN